MKQPSIIIITLSIMVARASAHPGKPGHTHDEWPFPEIEWSMVGIAGMVAVAGIGFALGVARRKARKEPVAG